MVTTRHILLRIDRPLLVVSVLIALTACDRGNSDRGNSDRGNSDRGNRKSATSVRPAVDRLATMSVAQTPLAQVPIKRLEWDQLDDAAKDGWQSEVFADSVAVVFQQLSKYLSEPAGMDLSVMQQFVTDDFASAPLVPALDLVFEDGPLAIHRASESPLHASTSPLHERIGRTQFAAALREFAGPTLDASRTKFKVFRVVPSDEGPETLQYVSVTSRTREATIERHATWKITWAQTDQRHSLRIRRLEVIDFEQTTRCSPQWFSDCTDAVFAHEPYYHTQILQGYGAWLSRIPHGIYLEAVGTPGIALGDVNGDGREDLYFCQERGLPNRLFLQQADGTLRDVAAEWSVDWLPSSRAALLVDLDNDGDQDLVVSVMGGVVVAANHHNQGYQFRGLLPTSEDVMSVSAADYDADGDLDLYACGYYPDKGLDRHGIAGTSALPTAEDGFVLHDANVGGPNQLMRNDIVGDRWRFTDVTKEVGLDVNNRRFSFAAAWEDFDNDGDADLYVVNEFGRDNMYRNDGGQFTDVSENSRVEDAGSGMGITWGDYNRDGQMDVYISNMFSAAGNRITFQDQFKADAPVDVKRRIQRLTRGNSLLQNRGNGRFQDLSREAGVELGRWSWASQFVDLNNDGWLDLLVANGYITADDTGDL